MTIDEFITLKEAPRPIGLEKYIARCPAHDDHSPSLSIRGTADGRNSARAVS